MVSSKAKEQVGTELKGLTGPHCWAEEMAQTEESSLTNTRP